MKRIYYWFMRKLHPEDAWFWTEEWQAKEQEADREIENGEVEIFESFDDFLKSLDEDK